MNAHATARDAQHRAQPAPIALAPLLAEREAERLPVDLPIPAPRFTGLRPVVDPATIHAPRTLRELDRDPRDWWASAEAAAAEEEHVRAMFGQPSAAARRRAGLGDRVALAVAKWGLLLLVLIVCADAAGWTRILPGAGQ